MNHNTIGNVKYIELKTSFPECFDYDHWRFDLSLVDSVLYGSAIYTIKYIQYLFGSSSIDISGTFIPCLANTDELYHFQFVVDQLLVSFTITMNVPLNNEAVFYVDLGYIVVPNY